MLVRDDELCCGSERVSVPARSNKRTAAFERLLLRIEFLEESIFRRSASKALAALVHCLC